MPLRTEGRAPWRRRVAAAVADRRLWRKVEANAGAFVRAKARAYAELGGSERLRSDAARVKAEALARLPQLLRRLETEVRARGGEVYLASGPEEVGRIVGGIARRRGARLAVKSKSMLSEEVGLNRMLDEQGVAVVETDLGEYILQLAGDAPSHLVAPLLHRSKEECAQVLGLPAEAEAARLTALARDRLRERFLAAGIGISGGNFLVAETGTLVLVTNEGNGRMVSSLPPVHVAVVGVEKVVARLADLAPLLALLPRAATGQAITAYVSLITGPRAAGEADGPEEFHLVLVDNGRLAMRESAYASALSCIRCGACLNVCPVYRQVGGHAYGGPYPGPIGIVVSPRLGAFEAWAELADFCSLCGACSDACPVEIPLHEQIRELRRERVDRGAQPPSLRWFYRIWAWLWSSPRRYRWSAALARALQGPLVRTGPLGPILAWAPPPLAAWLVGRDLPALAEQSFRERWRARRGQA